MSNLVLLTAKDALDSMGSNIHTGIDLINNPPNDVPISDETLFGFGNQLELSRGQLSSLRSVAERVLTDCVQTLPNASLIDKIVISEPHLANIGRTDSGIDIVILLREGRMSNPLWTI